MFPSPHLLALVVLATAFSPLKHFRLVERSELPKPFLDYLCGDPPTADTKDCLDDFAKSGAVWAGDVNDDGQDEYILDAGGMPGTLGPPRSLLQRRAGQWVDVLCLNGAGECDTGWNTLHARFDILPIVRNGYHDLRVEVDHCLKWDGNHYVDYDSADYSQIHAGWFDTNDSHEAELFWRIRYQDRRHIQFEPRWFTVPAEEFDKPVRAYIGFPTRVVDLPKLPNVSRQDPRLGLKWLSFFKGGVWGVKGNRAFLLIPQPSYLGAQRLELHGDWLFIYGEFEEPKGKPDIRYNRRTHDLLFTEN
jgi:hypothetical protein